MYNTAYKHISFFHYKLPVHLQNSLLTLIAIVNPAYRSICPFYIILQLKYSSTTAHMCGTRPIHRTEKKKKKRERERGGPITARYRTKYRNELAANTANATHIKVPSMIKST